MNKYIDNNPWAGLSSYEDPEKAVREGRKPKLFCGRDDESHQVTQLISSNIFVTLYGKSGTGKTSLLNAGVFPRLRQKRYLPVSIRLSMDALDITFQQCIVNRLSQAISEHQGKMQTIEVVSLPADEQTPDYLWSFFARTRFMDGEGRTLFPVIVLDQFEEIFRNRRHEAEALLRQIAYLMDESHALTSRIVDGKPYKYDFNFRFVASIREDDLYRLEDSIDNNYLSELKRCRYRLRSLSEQGAQDVILIPGDGLFKTEEQKSIADAIIMKSHNEDGSISTNIVSLLCNRIFVDFQKSDADHITPALVENFIKGNPFERFYNEATRGFSNKEKSYIEDYLVDSTGRRNSIPESDFLLHVPKGKQLLEGDTRILQRTSTSSDGGNYRIELIHDSFCEPLAGLKEKREKRKRMLWFITTSSIALLCICITSFILYQINRIHNQEGTIAEQEELLRSERDSIKKANKYLQSALLAVQEAISQKDSANSMLKMSLARLSEEEKKLVLSNALLLEERNSALKNQALYIAKEIDQLIEKGDYFAAQKLSLEILSDKYPYTAEAAAALIKSTEGKSALFHGHTDAVVSVDMSRDGSEIISASNDGTIRLWNIKGECIKIFDNGFLYGNPNKLRYSYFSPNGQYVVSGDYATGAKIWNKSTGQCIRTLKLPDAYFLSDNRLLVCGFNDVKLYDLNRDRYLAPSSFIKFKNVVLSKNRHPSFWLSRDRTLMLTASQDSCLEIWDTHTFERLKTLKHDSYVWDARFNDDNSLIVSTCNEGLRIWDVKKGTCKVTIEPKKFFSEHAFFSPDQKNIIVGNQVYTLEGENKYSLDWGRFIGSSLNKKYLLGRGNNPKAVCIAEWNSGDSNNQYLINSINSNISLYGKSDCQLVLASDSSICIWDNEKGKCIKQLDSMGQLTNALSSSSLSISNDKRFLVSTGVDSIRIWRTDNWEHVLSLGYDFRGLNYFISAELSSNNKLLTIVSPLFISVYDIMKDKNVMLQKTQNKFVNGNKELSEEWTAAKLNHKGKSVAASRENGTVTIYDLKSGNIEHSIKAHNRKVSDLEFSPDDRILASASWDNTIKLWSTKTGNCIRTLYGHVNVVNMIKFANQGKWLVSTSYDRSIRVWDVESGVCLKSIPGRFNSAVFSSDDKTILASSYDGVYLLPFPSLQEIIDETRQRFEKKPLTSEEKHKYFLE